MIYLDKGILRMATKRKTGKKKSVVDSAVRNAALLSDGCNPELVKGAEFDGIFEIPIIKKPKKYIVPQKLVPFSKMDKTDKKTFAVCEYENDFRNWCAHLEERGDTITIETLYEHVEPLL